MDQPIPPASSPAPAGDSAARVAAALAGHGLSGRILAMPATTRTAEEAAAALGCSVAAIAKSIVFRAKDHDRAVLVVASGANRVDEGKVALLLGLRIGRADAAFVRAATGFAIGGVAPVGHLSPPLVAIDRDLMALPAIWAAAGTPFSVFRLTPEELVAITGGTVGEVAVSR